MILLAPFRSLVLLGLLAVAAWAAHRGGIGVPPLAFAVLGSAIAARLVWSVLDWATRWYELGGGTMRATRGVVRRITTEAPVDALQDLSLTQSLRERVFALGTVCARTASAEMVCWPMIARPASRLDAVRSAMGVPGAPGAPHAGVLVIGLAGGIGSGKTAVARILADLGGVVTDSDADARAALDTPRVREQIVRWWGVGVLGSEGKVSRHAVAKIVFTDPEQRRRLESLVHPLVRRRRQELIDAARLRGVRFAVIDAPLLFEAGLDRECDAIIFVDASRDQRLARVRAARGWDEQELDRREKAQIPLDDKRARADEVIVNDNGLEALQSRVESALDRIRTRPSRRTRD